MKTFMVLVGLLLISRGASSQSVEEQCACSLLLKEAVQKVATNYAGFDEKVNTTTRAQYNKLVKDLVDEATPVTNERSCFEIIEKYTNWFNEPHLGVWMAVKSSAARIPKVALSEVSRAKLLKSTDELEGIWSNADQSEQYAIIKDKSSKNKYLAVTLKSLDSAWVPGMVKVEFYDYLPAEKRYRGMYYQKDFSGVLNGFTVNNDRIDHWFGRPWYRNDEAGPLQKVKAESEEKVFFKVLKKDFVYLKLGAFNQIQVDKLDSLIVANKAIIRTTKNLIIDLRGNGGGNSGSSHEMLKLIYTNPVVYPPFKYRSSEDLIVEVKGEIAALSANDPNKLLASKRLYLQKIMENPGQLVSTGDSMVRRVDTIERYPERVALLVDKGSASSSEYFTFEGKQSKKVTIFGTNTSGGMDYGNAHNHQLTCSRYRIQIQVPWSRNGWIDRFGFRIDNIGFAPDVRIPSAETDWLQFVVNYWSK